MHQNLKIRFKNKYPKNPPPRKVSLLYYRHAARWKKFIEKDKKLCCIQKPEMDFTWYASPCDHRSIKMENKICWQIGHNVRVHLWKFMMNVSTSFFAHLLHQNVSWFEWIPSIIWMFMDLCTRLFNQVPSVFYAATGAENISDKKG